MRRNPTTFIAAAVVVCGLALAGCSSNNGEDVVGPPRTSAALTKADYVAQANAICADAESKIVGFQNEGADDRAALLADITPVAQDAIDQLNALTPPAEDAAMISEGIGRMQATLNTAQTNPTAIIDPIGISGPELNKYGLTACFSAGPPLDTSGTTAP